MDLTPIYIITSFLLVVAVGIIMLVLVYQKKQAQYLKEKQHLQHNYQQELLRTQLEIQEQTFKNISQEIHDNIGQVLSLVKLNINTMPDCESKKDLDEKIADTRELVSKAIQDLRDLSKSLNADFVIEMGLIPSIEYELNLLKKIGGIRTRITIEGATYRLSHQKELILFRIFPEVINNIIKHAKASLVAVSINYNDLHFALQIVDDGDGFKLDELGLYNNNHLGLGIKNIENRSHIIGAACNIISNPGKGTTVTIDLPLNSE